jgi:glutamine cyclotransferase
VELGHAGDARIHSQLSTRDRIAAGRLAIGALLALAVLLLVTAPAGLAVAQSATPSAGGLVCGTPIPDESQLPATLQASYQVVSSFSHDPTAFTEGLVWFDNGFFESTGLEGHSSLRRVDFPSGKVLQEVDLAPDLFGEGVALVGNQLVQLTWQSHIGFVYDRDSLTRTGMFPYARDGWGLTYDGTHLIASDGSDSLSMLDPSTEQPIGSLAVTIAGCPVRNLNELEWINGEIWANIWLTDVIVRIDPTTGNVNSYLDLAALRDPALSSNRDAVLNGIAFDPDQQRIFVTGKLWPTLYQIQVSGQPPATQPQ